CVIRNVAIAIAGTAGANAVGTSRCCAQTIGTNATKISAHSSNGGWARNASSPLSTARAVPASTREAAEARAAGAAAAAGAGCELTGIASRAGARALRRAERLVAFGVALLHAGVDAGRVHRQPVDLHPVAVRQ